MKEPPATPDDKGPSRTPFEAFNALAKRVLSVPKSELDERERAYQRSRMRERAKKARSK